MSWHGDAILTLILAPDGTWRTQADAPPAQEGQPAWDEACWHVFADAQARLHPQLAALLHRHGQERPGMDIVYGDEVIAASPGCPPRHFRKPDFDETQLIARDYIGLPIAIRGQAMAVLGGLHASAASAQTYDMLLRAMLAGLGIGRIAQVLAVNRPDAVRATATDQLAALRRFLSHGRADCDVAPGLMPSTLELRRRFDDPPHVTFLILASGQPTPARSEMAAGLLNSLCRTDWPMDRLHVVMSDNALAGLQGSWPFDVRHLATAGRAAGANLFWQASDTEQLVFLDDALLVRSPSWLRALMTFAVDDGIGGVGARLLHPDGSIRHAVSLAADAACQDSALAQRECPLVPGEAFATRRSLLEQANGFDERFSYGNGQADFCLRLRMLGFRIVHTPHAELTQLDAVSYDNANSEPDETALLLEKWQGVMADDSQPSRDAPATLPVPSDKDWWRYPEQPPE